MGRHHAPRLLMEHLLVTGLALAVAYHLRPRVLLHLGRRRHGAATRRVGTLAVDWGGLRLGSEEVVLPHNAVGKGQVQHRLGGREGVRGAMWSVLHNSSKRCSSK